MTKRKKPDGRRAIDTPEEFFDTVEKMARKKNTESEEPEIPKKITDIEAARWDVEQSVCMFMHRWTPLAEFSIPCEVMDQGNLRDAMGLRATIDLGDPWPIAEQMLLSNGYLWHLLGTSRVMFLREREDLIAEGYDDADEV